MSGAVKSRPGSQESRAARAACAHCGLDVPPSLVRAREELSFCCAGCRRVYELLHEWGFEAYYRIREHQQALGRPARLSGRSFEDFDDALFAAEHVESSQERGTCRTRLYLEGVHCAACVWLVEALPRSVDGLISSRLNLVSAVVELEWDPSRTSLSQVARALDSVGYPPHPHLSDQADRERRREERSLLIKLGVAAACAMNIMLLGFALYAGEHSSGMEPRLEQLFRWVSLGLALPVMLWSAQPFYRAAWAGLRQRVPHMDLPIALALTAAFGYSAAATVSGSGPIYFDSLAALTALLLGARYVQRRAGRVALERAASLRGVAFAEFARRLERLDDLELAREVPLGVLRAGDRVEVRSGELVPVDGRVVAGSSTIDNAVLTGEPLALAVAVGDTVHAGAQNLGGRLTIEVVATGAETRVGALLALVEEALAKRPPIVQIADRLSRWFVAAVLALAAVTALLWLGTSLEAALEQTIAMLVVTCPCALGLATPVALSVGLARAARAGIFIKRPDAIEELCRIDTVVLDKTGTLTEGRATISRWSGAEQAVELAYALEGESSHPIAEAFRASAGRPLHLARAITGAREIAGGGITGLLDGHAVAVGNGALLDQLEVARDGQLQAHAEALLAAGLSPLYVAVDGVLLAVGGVGDPLRPEARATVAELVRRGLTPHILSGDHPEVVARVAGQLGLEPGCARGGLTPEDKRAAVAALKDAGCKLVMVGDGANDAAAMALCDVAVAVCGGAGASLAAADVVLTRPGLGPLSELLTGARLLLWVLARNLAFSLIYNAAGAALALAGLIGPLWAAVLMPLSSLTVILSSVLARPFRRHKPRRTAARKGAEVT